MPIVLALALLAACAGLEPPPVLPELRAAEERLPVIMVPGLTGVTLVDPEAGATAWGRGIDLLLPRDGGRALACPVAGGVQGEHDLVPGEVIETIGLGGVYRKPVYGPILELLEANGYHRGDLSRPDPAATLYPFAYDWRQSNVTSAARLAERLDELRRARGGDLLEVVLLCQSNGAHICRYLAKYGGAPLAEAEAGRAGPPPGLRVAQVVLVGSANGGSIRILREMNRGRRYIPWIGRRFLPEVFFTFEALYQDLPLLREDPLFVSDEAADLAVELTDPGAWERYGWSAFAEAAAARLADRPPGDPLGSAADRERFLARALAEARRLQRLLARDAPGFATPRYDLVRNDSAATPDRAVLERSGDAWATRFLGDRSLAARPALRTRITAPGDGHATRASQLALSPQEAARVARTVEVSGGHFEMILEPETLHFLAEVLAEGVGSQGRSATP